MIHGKMTLYLNSVVIHSEIYVGEKHRQHIINEWFVFMSGRKETFYIQYRPSIDLGGGYPIKQLKTINRMRHLADWQIETIDNMLGKAKPKDIAKAAEVSQPTVYARRKAINMPSFRRPEMIVAPDSKEFVRPKAQYTNGKNIQQYFEP